MLPLSSRDSKTHSWPTFRPSLPPPPPPPPHQGVFPDVIPVAERRDAATLISRLHTVLADRDGRLKRALGPQDYHSLVDGVGALLREENAEQVSEAPVPVAGLVPVAPPRPARPPQVTSYATYQAAIEFYIDPKMNKRDRLIDFSMGLVGEAAEVRDQVKRQGGQGVLFSDLVKELGDELWYITALFSLRGEDFTAPTGYWKPSANETPEILSDRLLLLTARWVDHQKKVIF